MQGACIYIELHTCRWIEHTCWDLGGILSSYNGDLSLGDSWCVSQLGACVYLPGVVAWLWVGWDGEFWILCVCRPQYLSLSVTFLPMVTCLFGVFVTHNNIECSMLTHSVWKQPVYKVSKCPVLMLHHRT